MSRVPNSSSNTIRSTPYPYRYAELEPKDAILYLDQIKFKFGDKPSVR